MSEVHEKPSIAERYTRSTQTSDLRVRETACDADLVIACAFASASASRDGSGQPLPASHPASKRARLAGMLHRLNGEFDSVRAHHEAAEARLRISEQTAAAEAKTPGPNTSRRTRETGKRNATVAEAMILINLKTLPAAKEALAEFAVIQATKRRFMKSDRDVMNLTGKVLRVFLEPKCRNCHGLGFLGSSIRGEIQSICRECKGTTQLSETLGRDAAENEFAKFLLAQMDMMLREVEAGMAEALRSGRA